MYSDSIMSRYTGETQNISRMVRQGQWTAPEATNVLRFKSTLNQFLALMQDCAKDDSGSGLYLKREYRDSQSQWAGIRNNQTTQDICESGLCASAIEDFEKARAKLETPLSRNSPALSPIGGAFSMGRIIQGHPKACLTRPKTKLPVLNLEFSMRALAQVEPEIIAQRISRIARAAWEYKTAGGIVNLSISYLHWFGSPVKHNGQEYKAVIHTIRISPDSMKALATAASVQFYRGVSMVQCRALAQDGSVPASRWIHPTIPNIDGTRDDDAALKRLGIA